MDLLLRSALPAALALWFIWKARSTPLFLLGIPVLMVMRSSVFFQNVKPFWMPGRLAPVTLLMGWLTLVWLVTVVRHRWTERGPSVGLFGPARILPEELPLIGIALLIAVHTLASFSVSRDLMDAVDLAAATSYFLLGYILVRGIVSRATRAETEEFLAAVVLINTFACLLFLLDQGLGLPIYLGAANADYVYAGQVITRATVYAPVFNLLALGFVLAKRRWSPGWIAVLAITLAAIMVSLTRTMLVAALTGLVIAILARELGRPNLGRMARRVGATVLAVAAVVIVFSRVAPAYWAILLQRLSEFTSGGRIQNWHVRMVHWDAVESVVSKTDLVSGLGFPQPGSNAVDANVWLWSSDMAWLPIMYRFGYLGLVLFALLLAGFAARALLLSLSPSDSRRELALTYFIVLALTAIMSLENWVFMNPDVSPMGLWIFALIAGEALRPAEEPELIVTPMDAVPAISRVT